MFSEVIAAHVGLENGTVTPAEYRKTLAAFAGKKGKVDEIFWGSDGKSGVAVTLHGGPLRRRAQLHRVSDLATARTPEIAGLIQNWDVLAVRAQHLRGPNAQVGMRWIFSAVSYLLGIVLATSTPPSRATTKDIVKRQTAALAAATQYYSENASRGAYLAYFWGMCFGALCNGSLAFGFVALVHWGVPHLWGIHVSNTGQAFAVGAVVAGAMGTILSVLLRMTRGGFAVSYEIGFSRLFVIGSFRPFIGAVTGLATFFAVRADLAATAPTSDKSKTFALIAFLAFVSGFSERFARDTIMGMAQTAATGKGTAPATGTTSTGSAGS